MSEEQSFLAALKANPADDTTRLVYADWLDDRGDAARAEYLRAVVELSNQVPVSNLYIAGAGMLFRAVQLTPADWRREAGGRFDLVLTGYDAAMKIVAIRSLRMLKAWGLAEGKAFSESVPAALFSWSPFETVFDRLFEFHQGWGSTTPMRDGDLVIRPTPWPAGIGDSQLVDIVLVNVRPSHAWANPDVYFNNAMALILGIAPDDVDGRLQQLPITLAAGVRPPDVAAKVLSLRLKLNVYNRVPRDGIQLIPRTPPT